MGIQVQECLTQELTKALPKRHDGGVTVLEETFFNCMGRFAEAATNSDIILCDLHMGNVMRNPGHPWKIVDFEFARNGHALRERHKKGGEEERAFWPRRKVT